MFPSKVAISILGTVSTCKLLSVLFFPVKQSHLNIYVEFRDELFKECIEALQGGLLLTGNDFNAVREALQEAFTNADTKLLNW